jgi:hypothetical protein
MAASQDLILLRHAPGSCLLSLAFEVQRRVSQLHRRWAMVSANLYILMPARWHWCYVAVGYFWNIALLALRFATFLWGSVWRFIETPNSTFVLMCHAIWHMRVNISFIARKKKLSNIMTVSEWETRRRRSSQKKKSQGRVKVVPIEDQAISIVHCLYVCYISYSAFRSWSSLKGLYTYNNYIFISQFASDTLTLSNQ